MRRSELFIKTLKEDPKDEVSKGTRFLIRAGFINKTGAGIYSFLPLGLKVINKIENIVRQEMLNLGAFEILMPALHPKQYWEQTGRWQTFETLFKIEARRDGGEFGLGPTHEEIVVPLMKEFINSYKDLPTAVFQIQTKFRDEPRPRSGLIRGREFLMKDLYSFHTDEKDAEAYYEKAARVYEKIFKTLGLNAVRARASGGAFSKYSDEFQTPAEAGEDTIYICQKCKIAFNKELAAEEICPECQNKDFETFRGIEVGNIFKLKTKFSEPFDLRFKSQDGSSKPVIMGCYGIGISRLLGTIAEVSNDENGLIWPQSVSPFKVHLLNLVKKKETADKIYKILQDASVEVLYDDREDAASGEKLIEADLFGVPIRLVISDKTIKENKIETKKRTEEKARLIREEELLDFLK
jgi:prolyl-tRNA synthetase